MTLTTAKLDTLLNLLTALAQRQDNVRQLAAQLHTANLWRSTDGSLAVAITADQHTQVEGIIKAYLDESQAIIDTARVILAPPAGEGG